MSVLCTAGPRASNAGGAAWGVGSFMVGLQCEIWAVACHFAPLRSAPLNSATCDLNSTGIGSPAVRFRMALRLEAIADDGVGLGLGRAVFKVHGLA